MRKLRTALLAGAGVMLVAGAAVAAEKYHVVNVALPDGSVAQVQYQGDVAPRVVIADAPVQRIALADPFADMDGIFAAMEAQHQQMMQRVAQMEAQMADAMKQAQSQTRTVSTANGAAPANGVVQYSFVSTTNANGCTTSVQWRSDGSRARSRRSIRPARANAAPRPIRSHPPRRPRSAPKANQTRGHSGREPHLSGTRA